MARDLAFAPARRRSERRLMDVKVLYTLDSIGHHTMIARADRRVPVRVAAGSSSSAHDPGFLLGRVPLKTCLGAICLASPELVLDRANDYIVYAVDPEESHRVGAARSPRRAAPTPHASARADEALSPSKPGGTRAPAPVLVGKGFFSGALEEPGDGTSSVTGRVRMEMRQASAFSSDEDDEGRGVDVLEIVLRMKEAPLCGREKYLSMMRGMAAGDSAARRAALSPASRDAPTAPGEGAAQTTHLLQVLQALQSHPSPSAPPEQQTQLANMLSMVAGALQSGALATQGGRSTAHAGAPQQASSPPQPGAPPLPSPHATLLPSPGAFVPPAPPRRSQTRRVCYNCGTTTGRTWRILQLGANTPVHYAASERPPADAVPLTWTPRYRGHTSVAADGETRWQACNPCGLYYAKYGVSRPDHVLNFGAARSKESAKRRESGSDAGRESSSEARAHGSDVTRAKKVKTEPNPAGAAPQDPLRTAQQPDRAGAARTGLGRTLSAVANRDAERLRRLQTTPGADENTAPASACAARRASPADSVPPPLHSFPSAARRTPTRGSPSRYQLPACLVNSSPATVMNALMSDTDFDLDDAALQRRGARGAVGAAPPSPSPVRRSPRKKPPGTHDVVNPFATHGLLALSPTRPPRPASSPQRRTHELAVTPRRLALTSPGMQTRSRSARRPGSTGDADAVGPFMGLPPFDDDSDALGCPSSPSVGRRTTARARLAARAADAKTSGDAPTPSRLRGDDAEMGRITPMDLALGGDGVDGGAWPIKDVFSESDWLCAGGPLAWGKRGGGGGSEGEAVPGGEDGGKDKGSGGSEDTGPGGAEDRRRGGAGNRGGAAAGSAEARSHPPAAVVARRRPLPATVEDGSSSQDSSPEGYGDLDVDNLAELIEDPYGILAASGIGVLAGDGAHGDTLAVTSDHRLLDGISIDAFNGIELHQAPAFAHELHEFSQSGGPGIAAHVAPSEGLARMGPAAAHGLPPCVQSFSASKDDGGAPGTGRSGDLETFLDDPSVQAMLAELPGAHALQV
ncbi:hypothetical protein MSPP1_001842 [Malassezia sp. CBS 17886]|nr:hypothetical protein MSPP1_001842 [Malassezia sp. CBS 17886]